MSEIALIADIHVAHRAAIWPEKFVTPEGQTILPNKEQLILLSYWEDFWSYANSCEYVFNLAETIEGVNKKEHGADLMISSIDEQIKAAGQLLKPKVRGKKYVSVHGSKYHGSDDTPVEKIIADMLEGCASEVTYCGAMGNLMIGNTGKLIQITHKSGSSMLYKVTQLARKSLYMSAIKSKIKLDPDAMIYAHDHQYFSMRTPTRTLILCPTWKFWHPIKDASKYEYTQPTIGGLILKVPKHGKIEIDDNHLYPLEHIYDAIRGV